MEIDHSALKTHAIEDKTKHKKTENEFIWNRKSDEKNKEANGIERCEGNQFHSLASLFISLRCNRKRECAFIRSQLSTVRLRCRISHKCQLIIISSECYVVWCACACLARFTERKHVWREHLLLMSSHRTLSFLDSLHSTLSLCIRFFSSRVCVRLRS